MVEIRHGGAPNRVLRGGSWNNNDSTNLLSSNRNNDTPTNRNDNNGFRVVLVVGCGGMVACGVAWAFSPGDSMHRGLKALAAGFGQMPGGDTLCPACAPQSWVTTWTPNPPYLAPSRHRTGKRRDQAGWPRKGQWPRTSPGLFLVCGEGFQPSRPSGMATA